MDQPEPILQLKFFNNLFHSDVFHCMLENVNNHIKLWSELISSSLLGIACNKHEWTSEAMLSTAERCRYTLFQVQAHRC